MNTDPEVSIEQEVADVKMGRPHVVVLGAGASRATCPSGDKNKVKSFISCKSKYETSLRNP